MEQATLGAFEFEVLSVLIQHPANAYGSTIRQRIGERAGGHEPSVGALYTTLERLEKKGFVSSTWGDATPERGGRRKRFYRVEAAGQWAVKHTENRQRRWSASGGLAQVVT